MLAREDQGLHEIIDEVEEDLLAAGADVAKVRDILQATNAEIIRYALWMSEVEAAVVTAEIVDEILTVATRDGGTEDQTSLKWYSTIAVLSGTLAPAGTFLKNNDKICPAD